MAPQPEGPEIVVANTSAMFDHDGQRVRLIKGKTTVEIGHPILKGRAHMFEPFAVDFPIRQKEARVAA